jgi:hypothetical protein
MVPAELVVRLQGERAMGAWDRVAATLAALAKATATSDPAAAVEYLRELAQVHLDRLGDADGAIEGYHRLLEIDSTDQRAMAALQPIQRMGGRWMEWVTVQKMRIDLAPDPAAQVALLRDLVVVCRDELADERGVDEAVQRLRDLGA